MAVSFFFQEGLKRLSSDSLSIENRNTRDHSCRRQVDCKLKVVKRLGRGCYLEPTERAQSELGQKKKNEVLGSDSNTSQTHVSKSEETLPLAFSRKRLHLFSGTPVITEHPSFEQWNFGCSAEPSLSPFLKANTLKHPSSGEVSQGQLLAHTRQVGVILRHYQR